MAGELCQAAEVDARVSEPRRLEAEVEPAKEHARDLGDDLAA